MFREPRVGIFLFGLIILFYCQTVDATQPDIMIKVGISPFSPLVILTGDEPTGLSIDLWQSFS